MSSPSPSTDQEFDWLPAPVQVEAGKELEGYDLPSLQEAQRGFWERVRGQAPVIDPEFYRTEEGRQGFTLQSELLEDIGPLHPNDVKPSVANFMEVGQIIPGEKAHGIIKRLEQASDADMSTDRFVRLFEKSGAEAVLSTLGHFSAGAADVLISAVSSAYYTIHGLRAGIEFKDYLRIYGFQALDASLGIVCHIPIIKTVVDHFLQAGALSRKAFPKALERAIEEAKVLGISQEAIEAAVMPAQEKKKKNEETIKDIHGLIKAVKKGSSSTESH